LGNSYLNKKPSNTLKEQIKIPTTKVQRALKLVGTGAKIGGNYVKYWTQKSLGNEEAKNNLDESNATDIYDSLSELKGSALKVAQMLSMDKNILPQAYQNKFQMAQYSAPPLSYPLVLRTFKQELGKSPLDIFESFSQKAIHAASIGQVHKAIWQGKQLAVKIQYPGVAESVNSDLKMVKPIATRLLNLQGASIDKYFEEVREKLLEETDYHLELKRGQWIADQSKELEGVVFPKYYKEISSKRIISMEWIEGKPLQEFLNQNPNQETRNKIGQMLWDFYHFQIYNLKLVHADPHPGNFLVTPKNELAVLDFGCVKEIPTHFFDNYFELIRPETIQNPARFDEILYNLEFILKEDAADKVPFYKKVFRDMIMLLSKPFYKESFDFSEPSYFKEIYDLGEKYSKMKELKEANGARGSQHGIYINRTYFGLYNLLHMLGATVQTKIPNKNQV